MLVGYARISTREQSMDGQLDSLHHAGCDKVFTEVASGAREDRPVLREALEYARPGDVLVCFKLALDLLLQPSELYSIAVEGRG